MASKGLRAFLDGQGAKPKPTEAERTARCRANFVQFRSEAEAVERGAEIAALPLVAWKGKTLRTIWCSGTTGRGPHALHVPEALLWELIGLSRYRCAFHPGGA